LAAELVNLGVDVIFAPGDLPAAGAKQATQTIPLSSPARPTRWQASSSWLFHVRAAT
jgi:hypothetical protein